MTINWLFVSDIFFAALVGGIVSSGELIARYRDEPWDTLKTMPAFSYMLLNAIASGLALALAQKVGWTFGASGEAVRITQIMIAGFGALAIFRSAFFTVRVGDQDIAVGASSFLQVVLDAADRYVDRRRATERALKVKVTMKDISFEKAHRSLPILSITLMQNLPKEEQEKLFTDIAALKTLTALHNDVKAQVLGLMIMNVVGEEVLDAATDALCDQISKDNLENDARTSETTPKKIGKVLENLQDKMLRKEKAPVAPTENSAPPLDIENLIKQAKEGGESAAQIHSPLQEQAIKLDINDLIDQAKEEIEQDEEESE